MIEKSIFDIFLNDEKKLILNRQTWEQTIQCDENFDEFINYLTTKADIKGLLLINIPVCEKKAIKILSVVVNKVENFAISCDDLGDDFLKCLSKLALYSNIKSLNLYCPKATNNGLKKISKYFKSTHSIVENFYLHAGKVTTEKACEFIYDLIKMETKNFGFERGISYEEYSAYEGLITIKNKEANEFLKHISNYYLLMKKKLLGIYIEGVNEYTKSDRVLKNISDDIDIIPIQNLKIIFDTENKNIIKPKRTATPLKELCARYIVQNSSLFKAKSNLPREAKDSLENETKYQQENSFFKSFLNIAD